MRPHDDIATVDGRLLDELTTIVSAAAAAILAARAGSLEVRAKADLSPVTAADHAAEALILEGLARLLPGMCVVSEEEAGCAPPDRIPAASSWSTPSTAPASCSPGGTNSRSILRS